MDIEKFKDSPTGRLIKTTTNYWAFVPNPLPPAGLDKFSAEFVGILSEADRGIGGLKSLSKLIPNPNLLVAPYVRNDVFIQQVSNEVSSDEDDVKRQWVSTTANRYGSFLNFRGLQHAPINEQGVVFLFGMICFELGFIVEAVRSGFPDCEAKRRIDRKKDHWERVRIEFEYRSSTFREHGHNPSKCDLIVCWEHDWEECPLEVIELKSVIKTISD